MHRESIVIVTPALADANNGNWQTAHRWARMLQPAYRVRVVDDWAWGNESLMIALHARRSAPSVAAWRDSRPHAPLVVTLTGTDLYRDIDTDAAAQRSLVLADALVVLNELGARRLPADFRGKARVLLQSCPARKSLAPPLKPHVPLRALMVGHLRDEKDPRTYFRAAARLAARPDILLDHIGAGLDGTLAAEAAALAASQPNYRWLGAMPHASTRRSIQSAHVLVHPSRMEGGANAIVEALRSGTPVLASRIDGNLGLLGIDPDASFEVGDDAALAALLARARDDPAMLPALAERSSRRAPLFAPEAERTALHQLVADLLAVRPPE